MAKGFRLPVSWAKGFRFCRSKDDATAACSPILRVSPLNPKAFDTNFPHPHAPPRRKLHVKPSCCRCCPVHVVCRCVRSSCPRWDPHVDGEANGLSGESEAPPVYLWRKDKKWHVVARVESSPARRKIDSDEGGREIFPPLPIQRRRRRTVAAKQTRTSKTKSRARVSTSSADTRWFSSEDEMEYVEDYDEYDERELLMSSSRSLSTDYSPPVLNPGLKPIREHPNPQQMGAAAPSAAEPAPPQMSIPWRKSGSPIGPGRVACPSPESSSPAARRAPSASSVLSRFATTPLRSVLTEGKVRDSFAVVKRSEDPYGDFRRSMVEMVVENQMYEERDLEQLLHCFLLLNSCHHHPAIIRAFSDIWAALFPSSHSGTSTAATPPPSVSF